MNQSPAATIRWIEENWVEPITQSNILREAAFNCPTATRKEFVAAAVSCGYRANSAGNRFLESRKQCCIDFPGYVINKDGSLSGTDV
jgi:hypothetical protein